jgi:hypothetical protein
MLIKMENKRVNRRIVWRLNLDFLQIGTQLEDLTKACKASLSFQQWKCCQANAVVLKLVVILQWN